MSLTTITRSKPFYVVAGAGDLAVRTVRELPARLSSLQAEAGALPGRAQTAAVDVVVGAVDVADAAYGELLGRGRKVVGRIRRQQATQDLQRDAATTVRRTRTAGRTAASGASDTRSAAKATATTAKKAAKGSTSRTTTSAKRTATTARTRSASTAAATKKATRSARSTATSAGAATAAGASKVGR